MRTKLYPLPLQLLLYEYTLTLHFIDIGSPGHRLQGKGIILDVSPNMIFKAIKLSGRVPTGTRNRTCSPMKAWTL